MKGRIVAGIFLCALFLAAGGAAQNRDAADKPVWTLEFIQVQGGKFGLALGYLDDHWMRERAEARKEGAVLDYHRIQNTVLVTPGRKVGDPNSMVLITEYKNMAAFLQSEKLFASIRERLPKSTPGVFKPTKPDDPYETVDSQVFVEEPETSGGFKLVAKR
jgi:hypothetical protein